MSQTPTCKELERELAHQIRYAETLKENEKRFKALYDRIPLGYQSLSIHGRLIEVNQAWLDMLGYKKAEVIGKPFDRFLHSDSIGHFASSFQHFKASGRTVGAEFRMVKKSGVSIWVSFHGKIGKDDKGNFKQTYCIMHEITDQKRMEEKLRENEVQLQSILKTIPGAIYQNIVSKDGALHTSYISESAEEIFERPSAELTVFSKLFDSVHIDDLDELKQSIKSTNGHVKSWNYEFRITTPRGRTKWIRAQSNPFRRPDGRIVWNGTIIDITERKRFEEALLNKKIELQANSKKLEEMNTALKVLLEHREDEKKVLFSRVQTSFQQLVCPYFDKIHRSNTRQETLIYLEIMRQNTEICLSALKNTLPSPYLAMTPMETQIADLIKVGKTSKEIASMLNISPRSVYFHRNNIRNKLNLKHKKANLRTVLNSIY
jgi:PAS domain S-box-containing protein